MSLAPRATQSPFEPGPPLRRGIARHSGIGDEGAHAVPAQSRLELRREALARRKPVARGQAVAEGEDMDVPGRGRGGSAGHQQERVDKPARGPIWEK
jgi:hypothetical protein